MVYYGVKNKKMRSAAYILGFKVIRQEKAYDLKLRKDYNMVFHVDEYRKKIHNSAKIYCYYSGGYYGK